jgi:serine O-acetyltransferase
MRVQSLLQSFWKGTSDDDARESIEQLRELAPQNIEAEIGETSAKVPDWSRERCRRFWDPSRRLLRSIRYYQKWKKGAVRQWFTSYWVLQHRFWSVVTGADIPLNSQIAGGLLLSHPNGVVIFPDAIIGPNCVLFQQVTIGTGGGPKPEAPILGGHVQVGAGAKILGGVKIGDHAIIAAMPSSSEMFRQELRSLASPAKLISLAQHIRRK